SFRRQPFFGFINADPEDLATESKNALTRQQSGMGSAGRSRKHDPVSASVLIDQLLHSEGVSERAGRIRSAVRNQVRVASLLRRSIKRLLQNSVAVHPIGDVHNLRSE